MLVNGYDLDIEAAMAFDFVMVALSKGEFRFGAIQEWLGTHFARAMSGVQKVRHFLLFLAVRRRDVGHAPCRLLVGLAGAPIAFKSAIIPEGSFSVAALRFSRRCAMEDVPGISRMLGER